MWSTFIAAHGACWTGASKWRSTSFAFVAKTIAIYFVYFFLAHANIVVAVQK